jgi:hypothetical protein
MFTLDKMISEIDLCCRSASSEVVAVCDEPRIRMLNAASIRMTEDHRFWRFWPILLSLDLLLLF